MTNLTQRPIIKIFRTVQHSLVMLPQGLSLAPGCMSRFYSPFTSNEGIPPDREKREEQHRAQTNHSSDAPPPNGHANIKPKTGKITWTDMFLHGPQAAHMSHLRYARCGGLVGCVRAGGPDRSRGWASVCVRVPPVGSAGRPGTPTHTPWGRFPWPVLPRFLTTPSKPIPSPPTPQQPHPHQPSISSLCHQSLPSPLSHPSCGFDVQLPCKQGTPL